MIPHERSLVDKWKDRPFALIGVNSDRTNTEKGMALYKEKQKEIEGIAESSRIFRPNEFDQLATFLDYAGPAVVQEPETVGDFVAPELSADEITEWTADAQPYLEMVSPELPEIRQPRQVREKPRLSTGEHPVALQAVGTQWALRCTGCGVHSEPRAYKWQAMEDKVECTCVR